LHRYNLYFRHSRPFVGLGASESLSLGQAALKGLLITPCLPHE
jgi:hypothetical protein